MAASMHNMLMTLTSRRISSSDIKDKSQLTEARKSVERQMERFKVQIAELKCNILIVKANLATTCTVGLGSGEAVSVLTWCKVQLCHTDLREGNEDQGL